jgi:hypothetical protein
MRNCPGCKEEGGKRVFLKSWMVYEQIKKSGKLL